MAIPLSKEIPFPKGPEEAPDREHQLAQQVRLGQEWRYVGGACVAYRSDYKHAYAAAVVVSASNWRVIASATAEGEISWGGQTEVQAWREGTLICDAIHKLSTVPDVMFVQGHGIAHVRRFGLACLVGLAFDLPCVGVASEFPSGCHVPRAEMGDKRRGQKRSLLLNPSNQHIGAELITQDREDPVCVSPGHRVSVQDAVAMTLKASPWFRFPEPLRAAKENAESFRDRHQGV